MKWINNECSVISHSQVLVQRTVQATMAGEICSGQNLAEVALGACSSLHCRAKLTHCFSYGHRNLFLRKNSSSFRFRRGGFGAFAANFRRGRFGVTVSAWRFRRTGFGNVKLFFLEEHTVLFGANTLFFLERTHSLLWKEHIVLFGNNRLFSLARTQCSLWEQHIALFGKNTLFSLETIDCLLWKQKNVLCGNDKTTNKILVSVVFWVLFRQPYVQSTHY